MKPVVDLAHKYGLAFGLYTCAGTETCVGGRPGSKDHWTQDAQLWAEWQVDWMKVRASAAVDGLVVGIVRVCTGSGRGALRSATTT